MSAFDMNERRLSRLEGNAQATGATNVVAQQVCHAPQHPFKPISPGTLLSSIAGISAPPTWVAKQVCWNLEGPEHSWLGIRAQLLARHKKQPQSPGSRV